MSMLAVDSTKLLTWKLFFAEFAESWESYILLTPGFSRLKNVFEFLISVGKHKQTVGS